MTPRSPKPDANRGAEVGSLWATAISNKLDRFRLGKWNSGEDKPMRRLAVLLLVLAAVLPGPLKRRPDRMNQYSAIILARMRQMGW